MTYDAIIIGGSYAGLSAAMALGRSLRSVLIIDSGKPCNRQTPHSHNFLTHDGETPQAIAEKSKQQVLAYDTVTFREGLATTVEKTEDGFRVQSETGNGEQETFHGKKLLFATGVSDNAPEIPGFAECWGISVLHCPYCHGYEVRKQHLGVIANGEVGFEMAKLINHWADKLTLFTNGASSLTEEQTKTLTGRGVEIHEAKIGSFSHTDGRLEKIVFADGTSRDITAVFAKAEIRQHCHIPEAIGCEITEPGHIWIDDFHRTSVPGVYAAGDNTSMLRSVAQAVSAGNKSGAVMNRDLIEDTYCG
jgi:thioredoxin reductase